MVSGRKGGSCPGALGVIAGRALLQCRGHPSPRSVCLVWDFCSSHCRDVTTPCETLCPPCKDVRVFQRSRTGTAVEKGGCCEGVAPMAVEAERSASWSPRADGGGRPSSSNRMAALPPPPACLFCGAPLRIGGAHGLGRPDCPVRCQSPDALTDTPRTMCHQPPGIPQPSQGDTEKEPA